MSERNPMANLETKQILTEAFFTLYQEKPINKITIKEVTEKAGFHRSTFYEYFTDIYDLLEQEEKEIYQLQKDLLLTPIKNGTLSIHNNTFLTPLNLLFEKKGEKIALLISPHGDGTFRKKLQERIKTAIISKIQKKAKNDSNNNEEYLAEFLSSGLLSVFEMAYKKNANIEEVIQQIYPFISRMLP